MKIDIESGENGIAAIGCIHFLKQAFRPIVVGYRQCMLSKLREPAVESIVEYHRRAAPVRRRIVDTAYRW